MENPTLLTLAVPYGASIWYVRKNFSEISRFFNDALVTWCHGTIASKQRKFQTTPRSSVFNSRRVGRGVRTPPPYLGFSQLSQKRRHGAPPFSAHLFIHLFRTFWENFRPRSLKVRSPGHVVISPQKKVWMLVIATPNDRSHWNFQQLIFVTVSKKCISRNFDIGDPYQFLFRDLSITSQ